MKVIDEKWAEYTEEYTWLDTMRKTSRICEDRSCFTITSWALSWQAINFNHRRIHNSTRGYGKLSRGRNSSCAFYASPSLVGTKRFSEERWCIAEMKVETTAQVLVRTGKKAVVRLGDIAGRGQLPRLAPTSSAFVHERRDSPAFSVCHAFNFAARNYILCRHYTVCEKSACTYFVLHSRFSHPRFPP